MPSLQKNQCASVPLIALIPLILNQIRRNQGIRFLINCPQSKTAATDPFDNSTDDLNKTNAMDSSLWELGTLRKSAIPEVAKLANCKC